MKLNVLRKFINRHDPLRIYRTYVKLHDRWLSAKPSDPSNSHSQTLNENDQFLKIIRFYYRLKKQQIQDLSQQDLRELLTLSFAVDELDLGTVSLTQPSAAMEKAMLESLGNKLLAELRSDMMEFNNYEDTFRQFIQKHWFVPWIFDLVTARLAANRSWDIGLIDLYNNFTQLATRHLLSEPNIHTLLNELNIRMAMSILTLSPVMDQQTFNIFMAFADKPGLFAALHNFNQRYPVNPQSWAIALKQDDMLNALAALSLLTRSPIKDRGITDMVLRLGHPLAHTKIFLLLKKHQLFTAPVWLFVLKHPEPERIWAAINYLQYRQYPLNATTLLAISQHNEPEKLARSLRPGVSRVSSFSLYKSQTDPGPPASRQPAANFPIDLTLK